MKRILAITVLALASVPAMADWYYGGHHHGGYRGGNNWVAPLVIGGIAGAVIAHEYQPPVYVQQPPVYIQQAPVVVQQPVPVQPYTNGNCTAWKEIQTPDGRIYKERNCYQ
jgi:hypothetical protein